jgi:hypothetical protein
MSNKAHLRPHQRKRQASRTTGLLLVILLIALIALATAMVASGHAMPAGRIIPLRRVARLGHTYHMPRCRYCPASRLIVCEVEGTVLHLETHVSFARAVDRGG